jgi:hypothetical protein
MAGGSPPRPSIRENPSGVVPDGRNLLVEGGWNSRLRERKANHADV